MRMRRRTFLTRAGSALLFASGPVQALSANGVSRAGAGDTIIIIGAGMAGLAAANTLRHAGKRVLILEARNRIGGRIHTSEKWSDAKVDLGATWIHGDGPDNPVGKLARQLNARMAITSFSNDQAFDTDGSKLNAKAIHELDTLQSALENALTRAQSSGTDASLRDSAYRGLNYASRSSVERKRIDFLINTTIEHEYGGDAAHLSTYWYDSDKMYRGDDALFLDGYEVLIDDLASGLDIRLDTVVNAVSYDANGVTVTTTKGTFTGTYAIVTIPLGVLQSGAVTFSPALPRAKQVAIDKLGMGLLNKCCLRFPSAFWDTELDWINYIPESTKAGHWTEWVTLQRPLGQPVLLGFNAANFAKEIETWSDAAIVADAMRTLRTMYGGRVPNPTDWIITRWNADPYARGSYSYNKLGSTPDMRIDLAATVGHRLFFAGEATDRYYFQTVHGAYQSGIRAATELLAI